MRRLFLASILSSGLFVVAVPCRSDLPVFPGAVGHGTTTAAGRGGSVIKVTNRNDSGTGSLRAALETSGARTVVFEVSGYIPLASRIVVTNPYLTIAGQTAPPPGITIRDRDIRIATHDVLIQHLRFRAGAADPFPAEPTDGLQILSSTQPSDVYNVVVDHCSISWATDESLDLGRGAHDVTISNSIFAQALRRSVLSTGKGCYGPLVYAQDVTFYRDVFAHTGDRNPKFADATTGVFVNNVVYNATNSPDVQPIDSLETDPILLSFEGNVFKVGQTDNNLTKHALIVQYAGSQAAWNDGSQIWVDDNICKSCDSGGDWDDAVIFTGSPPSQFIDDLEAAERVSWPSGLSPIAASSVLNSLLPDVGAFPDDRDSLDEFVLESVEDSLGTLVDCVAAGEVTIDDGPVVSSSGANLVVTGALGAFASTYVSYSIRVSNGGTPQVRTVTAFNPDNPGGGSKTFTVDSAWSPVPDDSYTWTVFESCNANGGGWPALAEYQRSLVIPSDPNGDADSDGYTNLEEWIHTFPRDGAVVSAFDAYTDSTSGAGTHYQYQYKLRARWTTDIAANSIVQYRVLGNTSWLESTQSPSPSTTHMRVVSGLSAGSYYEVRAVSNASGVLSYSGIDTVITYDADIVVSNLDVSQTLVPGQGVTVTFSFTTSANTSCRINVRKEQSPPLAWGADEVSEGSTHSSHSHDVTGLLHNTVYHAYIQVFPNSSFGGEDTVYPDGAVPLSTATTSYLRITTPNKNGQGGGFEQQSAGPDVPSVTYLAPNYPNPFNPSTTIEFGLAEPGPVSLVVYDVTGSRVRTLVEGVRPAGRYAEKWDGTDDRGAPVASGVYMLRLSSRHTAFVRKLVVLK